MTDTQLTYSPVATSTLLARVIVKLLHREPFYAHILQGMSREITTTETETAAVTVRSGRIILLVNPEFFNGLANDEQRIGLLKHEVLHIVLQHLSRPESRYPEYHLLFNLAADMVVNQLITPEHLPPTPVTYKSFSHLSLEPNKSLTYYYEKLKELLKRSKPGDDGAPKADTKKSDSVSRRGKNSRKKSADKQNTQNTGSGGNIKSAQEAYSESHSDHGHWHKRLTDFDKAILRTAVKKLVAEAQNRGIIPAGVKQIISAENQKPAVIEWKQVLRQFIHRTGTAAIRLSIKRRSRRYGTRPGIRLPSQLRLLVAIDTSGSISNQNLQEFFREIRSLSRLLTEIWILECDAKVHSCTRYQPGRAITVTGRGGTDFDPVFEWINQRPAQFDAVVYLTDGIAPQPEITPAKPALMVINNDRHLLKPAKNLSLIKFKNQ